MERAFCSSELSRAIDGFLSPQAGGLKIALEALEALIPKPFLISSQLEVKEGPTFPSLFYQSFGMPSAKHTFLLSSPLPLKVKKTASHSAGSNNAIHICKKCGKIKLRHFPIWSKPSPDQLIAMSFHKKRCGLCPDCRKKRNQFS